LNTLSVLLLVTMLVGACEKSGGTPQTPKGSDRRQSQPSSAGAPPSRDSSELAASADPPASRLAEEKPTVSAAPEAPANGGHASTAAGRAVPLEGITMTVPNHWAAEPAGAGGAMAPKAVYAIPNPDGSPGSVRITYFPNMKGMDDANIQRWLGQVQRPDGSPATREDGKITVEQIGEVRVTTLDISGSIKPTMRDAAKANQRMIAAIVDHPRGPHFVVVVGEKALMDTEVDGIKAFLASARVR
jgi:hypothetical protein